MTSPDRRAAAPVADESKIILRKKGGPALNASRSVIAYLKGRLVRSVCRDTMQFRGVLAFDLEDDRAPIAVPIGPDRDEGIVGESHGVANCKIRIIRIHESPPFCTWHRKTKRPPIRRVQR